MKPLSTCPLLLALTACPVTEPGTETTSETGGPSIDDPLNVSLHVEGALPTDRVAVLEASLDAELTVHEVVADLSVEQAETTVVELQASSEHRTFVAVLYDDTAGNGAYDNNALHGMSIATRSFDPTTGWSAEDWSSGSPTALSLDSTMEVVSTHGPAPTIEATVSVSELSQPDRFTTVSAFPRRDGSGDGGDRPTDRWGYGLRHALRAGRRAFSLAGSEGGALRPRIRGRDHRHGRLGEPHRRRRVGGLGVLRIRLRPAHLRGASDRPQPALRQDTGRRGQRLADDQGIRRTYASPRR